MRRTNTTSSTATAGLEARMLQSTLHLVIQKSCDRHAAVIDLNENTKRATEPVCSVSSVIVRVSLVLKRTVGDSD